jgi:transposase
MDNSHPIGLAVSMTEDQDCGQVFIHDTLGYAWDAGDEAMRRFVAVKLWQMKAAKVAEIASAFGVGEDTLWKWNRTLKLEGFAALASSKRGPKGGSKLTIEAIIRIHDLKKTGLTNTRIGMQVGVSEFSVRRALTLAPAPTNIPEPEPVEAPPAPALACAETPTRTVEPAAVAVQQELPVLPAPLDRTQNRLAASFGALNELPPVFAPAARVPHAGMFLALPTLESTTLLSCASKVFTDLSHRVYGLNTLLIEGVLRTLVGEPLIEGASRLDPAAFGRILGMDRAPEVKTIRRQYKSLVATGKVPELMSLIAFECFQAQKTSEAGFVGVLYVDWHTRAYEGTN